MDARLLGSEEDIANSIMAYFTISFAENAKAGSTNDALFIVAGALLGLPLRDASSLFWKVSTGNAATARDFLRLQINRLCELKQIPTDAIAVTTTYDISDYRAFSHALKEDGKYRIDIWLSASAAFAYIALQMSHLIALYEAPPGSDYEAEIMDRVDHYGQVLKMLATASNEGGTVVFEGHEVKPALPRIKNIAIDLFLSALSFTLFHEAAHIILGHHASRGSQLLSSSEKHRQEHNADVFALDSCARLGSSNPWNHLLGATIVFLAASTMSLGPDNSESDSHPSLVDRFEYLCMVNDKMFRRRSEQSKALVHQYIKSVLANLFDRDRCPEWFGEDRLSVLKLPPDHKFQFTKLDFKSIGKKKVIDLTRSAAQGRKIRLI